MNSLVLNATLLQNLAADEIYKQANNTQQIPLRERALYDLFLRGFRDCLSCLVNRIAKNQLRFFFFLYLFSELWQDFSDADQ